MPVYTITKEQLENGRTALEKAMKDKDFQKLFEDEEREIIDKTKRLEQKKKGDES